MTDSKPVHEITVAAPPPVPSPGGRGALSRLLMPAVSLLAGVGMVAAVMVSGTSVPHNPMFVLFPVMMVTSAVAAAVQGGDRQRGELDADRTRYLGYLRNLGGRLIEDAVVQRNSVQDRNPAPAASWTLVGGPRMWQRHRSDSDFGQVRVGVGTVPATTAPVGPDVDPDDRSDPVTWTALSRFLCAYSTVTSTPVTVTMRGTPTIALDGDSGDTRALVRAMVCQLAIFHSPADLVVIAAVGDSAAGHWDWLKWLPHHRHPTWRDDVGAVRMVYPSLTAALAACPVHRYTVVIADGVPSVDNQSADVTVLAISAADDAVHRTQLDHHRSRGSLPWHGRMR